jgi:hypothetical protein
MLQIIDTAQPVNETDIASVGRRLGFSFPDDLKAHYLLANGGRPVPNILHVHGEEFRVHEFLPILHGKRLETIEEVFELMQADDRFPQKAIPFATDAGGDLFCYSIASSSFGRVFCWQSEYHEDPIRAVCWLTGSLGEFKAGLSAL